MRTTTRHSKPITTQELRRLKTELINAQRHYGYWRNRVFKESRRTLIVNIVCAERYLEKLLDAKTHVTKCGQKYARALERYRNQSQIPIQVELEVPAWFLEQHKGTE